MSTKNYRDIWCLKTTEYDEFYRHLLKIDAIYFDQAVSILDKTNLFQSFWVFFGKTTSFDEDDRRVDGV